MGPDRAQLTCLDNWICGDVLPLADMATSCSL